MRKAALLALALLLALPAAAQHEHHGEDLDAVPASVHVDIADPDVVARHPVTFTVLLLDAAGSPRAHQDMRVRATFAGTVLFEAPAATGHDYDGLNELTLTFPSPGPYKVELLDAKGKALAAAEGWAVERQQREAFPHLVGPASVATGEAAEYRMWPATHNGSSVKHFYTLFEAWDEEGLALQAKLHGHNDDQVNESVVQLAFPHPGQWRLRAHMFQAATYGPQLYSFTPLVTELTVDVTGTASPAPASDAPRSWLVRNGTGDKPLVATIDPQPDLGLGTPARLTTRAVSADGKLRTHVDFEGTLRDAAGRLLFHSDRLHESDGLLQLLVRPGVPGDYVWSTRADLNGTRIDVPFRVLDGTDRPLTATPALPAFTMGVPAAVGLALREGGQGAAHTEAELQVLDAAGRLQLAAKLHSHDGAFPFTLTLLDAGAHTLRLVPHGLGQDDLQAAPLELEAAAAPGAAWPVEHKPEPEPPATAAGDGPLPPLAWRAAAAVLLVGLALAGSTYAWRRMR